MAITIGVTELAILAAVTLALVRPELFQRLVRLVGEYLFREPAEPHRQV